MLSKRDEEMGDGSFVGMEAEGDRDSDERPVVSPLEALRRHWRLGAAVIIVGAAVGAGIGAVIPAKFVAEARIAVGSNDLTAVALPGYAYAAQQVAANTSRYVDNAQAFGSLGEVLGSDAASVEDVSASPIPESNIIRLEVTATSEKVARRGAEALTSYLIDEAAQVNRSSDADALLEQYAEISGEVAQVTAERDSAAAAADPSLSVLPPAEEASQRLVELSTQVAVLTAQQSALFERYQDAVTSSDDLYQLVTVAEAAPSYDTSTSQVQRYGLLGLVAGLLAALLASVVLERRRRRAVVASTPSAGGDRGAVPVHDDGPR